MLATTDEGDRDLHLHRYLHIPQPSSNQCRWICDVCIYAGSQPFDDRVAISGFENGVVGSPWTTGP